MKTDAHGLAKNTHPPNITILLFLIWLLLFTVTLMRATAVSAHSSLVKSEPGDGEVLDESPSQVRAWFSEELDSQFSTLRVFDSQDNQVDNGDGGVDLNDIDHLSMVASLPPLPSGTYSVRWVVLSVDDGDSTEGEFTFSVRGGDADGNSPAQEGIPGSPTLVIVVAVVIIMFIMAMWIRLKRQTSSD